MLCIERDHRNKPYFSRLLCECGETIRRCNKFEFCCELQLLFGYRQNHTGLLLQVVDWPLVRDLFVSVINIIFWVGWNIARHLSLLYFPNEHAGWEQFFLLTLHSLQVKPSLNWVVCPSCPDSARRRMSWCESARYDFSWRLSRSELSRCQQSLLGARGVAASLDRGTALLLARSFYVWQNQLWYWLEKCFRQILAFRW